MLQAIIRFSIKHKLMVMLLVLMLIIKGLFELSRLPLDALPDVTSNQVQVITVSPALAAPEVERLVTFTIEQYCSNIQGIVEMRSISRFGLSVVTLVFDDQTDVYWARQQVAERLGYIKDEIPIGAGMPFMAPLTTGLGEVYQYILKPAPGYEKIYSLAELRSIQDWIVRRQLIRLPGVADVSSFGGKLKQYEVSFRSDILNSMGLTVADVYEALQKNNQNSGGAYIEKNDQVLFIRTEGFIKNKEEIENIVIKQTQSSTPLLIKHVANVQLGHAIRYGALVNGSAGEVAGAVVLMLKGANAMEVVASLKKKIEEIKHTLPEGVVLEPFYDRSKMVNRSMNTVKTNLLEGALIVVFVLVLFLGNIRAGLIVASVIPLSMLFAVCMMNFFNVSGNLMSLGALDFGLIVDGAVIIVEAVMHRMRHMVQKNGNTKLTQETINKEVADTSHKIMNAAVFGQIIILIVYLPILALVGIEGKMFRPMAQTVSFALIGAFILSLTYVPMASALFIGNSIGTKETLSDKLMNLLDRLYTPAMSSALRFPKTLIIGVVFILGIALWMINTLGGEFIPELEEGDFAVDIRLPTGSSLTSSVQAATSASQLLESKFPEVEKIVCRVGASEIPTDPMPIEMGDLIILLKPKKEWTSAKTYDELANKMSETLLGIPGLSAGFQFPVQMRFNELISGARQDVVVKLFGENLDTLAAYASKIGTVVQKVNGATDLYVESIIGLPQISIEYNRQAIANYGANIADLNQVIQTAFAGQEAGTIYENERRFALVMRLEAPQRTSLEDVRRLLIPTASGIQVPLYLLANVTIK
jgi:cobalt-zinc-cadmium resistance protein CzcA